MTFSAQPEQFVAEGPEVYYAPRGVIGAGSDTIDWLIGKAAGLERRRARLCLHSSPEARIHDMIIVHGRDAYVRPHRHAVNGETLTILKGEATALTFDENGGIHDVAPMGPLGNARICIYRMPANVFHSLVIESEWLVFHETTAGPFDRANAEFAPWAPPAADEAACEAYLLDLRTRVALINSASA